MVFWRKKKNQKEQDQQDEEDKIIHHPGEPEIEPPVEYDSDISPDLEHELEETGTEIIEEIRETPVPREAKKPSEEKAREIEEHQDEGGWLSRLNMGLNKSSNKITKGLGGIFTGKKLDEDTLEALEEVLITADLGPKTAARLAQEIGKDRFGKEVTDEDVQRELASRIEEILKDIARPMEIKTPEDGPRVILVCGVNGVGKTTTIGKLAYQLHYKMGKKVMLAAGDTFRAAALEQLQVWADRVGCKLVKKELGSDAASVAFEAYTQAKEEGVDILLIDTAGRLHNKANLMAELEKIDRVLKKQNEALPHATILVLDATTGQNAHAQVETFKEAVNVRGLIVTKLDGSAKGGVVVSLADQFKLPIYAVGVGEKIDDLQPFKAHEFAESLVGLSKF